MTEKRIPIGENTALHLQRLPGDLIVSAWAEREIAVTAKGEIITSIDDGTILLSCQQDCILKLPADIDLSFDGVSGDARIADLSASIEGKNVNGDLHLHHTGPAKIGSVGGDLVADTLQGFLSASVGGDLKMSSIAGSIAVTAGGDAHLEFQSMSGETYAVQAGGDILCRLPAESDVTVNLQYGGSLRLSNQFTRQSGSGHTSRVVLGNGNAVLNLIAGGDMVLHAGAAEADAGTSDGWSEQEYGEEFSRQMDDSMRQVTDTLTVQLGALTDHLNTQLGGIPNGEEVAARVQGRIQKAIERAEHRVNRAVQKAECKSARAEKRSAAAKTRGDALKWSTPAPAPVLPPAPVGDMERTTILRMVEEGKLTVEQAEQLLSAMGA